MESQNLGSRYVNGARKFSLGSSSNLDGAGRVGSLFDASTSGLSRCKKSSEESSPNFDLNRNQPTSQNGRRLARARWQSESILEIDTSEDVAGGDGGSQPKTYSRASDSPRSVGLSPTWNPASLRYVKVNLNQGNFQSWPTTPRASPQPSTIFLQSSSTAESNDTDTSNRMLSARRQRRRQGDGTPTLEREPACETRGASRDEGPHPARVNDRPQPSSHNQHSPQNPYSPPNPHFNSSTYNLKDMTESNKISLDNGFQLSSTCGYNPGETPIKKPRSRSLLNLHEKSSSMDNYQRGDPRQAREVGNTRVPGTYLRAQERSNETLKDQQPSSNSSAADNPKQGTPGSPGSSGKSQAFIVRSTLCYNTSTQTDLVSCVDLQVRTHECDQEAEAENIGIRYHTSTRELSGKTFHDKLAQTDLTGCNHSVLEPRFGSSPHLSNETEKHFFKSPLPNAHMLPKTPISQGIYSESNKFLDETNYKPNEDYYKPNETNDKPNETNYKPNERYYKPNDTNFTSNGSKYKLYQPGTEYTISDSTFQPKTKPINSSNSHLEQPDPAISQDTFSHTTHTTGFRHDASSAFTKSASRDKELEFQMSHSNQSRTPQRIGGNQDKLNNRTSSSNIPLQHREPCPPFHPLNVPATRMRSLSTEPNENMHDVSWTSGLSSETSASFSHPRSFTPSQTTPSSRTISTGSNSAISPNRTSLVPSPSPSLKDTTYQWKKVIILSPEDVGRSRLGSDSVFTDTESDSPDDNTHNTPPLSSVNSRFQKTHSTGQSYYSHANNNDVARYSNSFTRRNTAGHNFGTSSKYRDRGFSCSGTLEEIGGRESTPSSGGGSDCMSESLADVISKVNENLAKSAQRVSGIRRSRSSLSTNILDSFGTPQHYRSRRQTDWTRLRSMNETSYDHKSGRWSSMSTYDQESGRWSSRSAYDHESLRWSSRSLDCENVFEDLNMSNSSPRRSSFAESRDRQLMFDGLSKNMHDVVVTSPVYQTSPTTRRPPPHPHRPPRPDVVPPPIPPRMNRQTENHSGENNTPDPHPSTTPLESSRHQTASQRENTRIKVIPLKKNSEEVNPGVDNSKVNFKDLINQWNSSSPGEVNHPEDTSKRPNKLINRPNLGQQPQQQLNKNMAPVISHPKPIVSFAATYRQEPLLAHASTALSSSSSSSSSTVVTSSSSPSMTPVPSSTTTTSPHNTSDANVSVEHPWNSSFASPEHHNSRTPTNAMPPSDSSTSLENSLRNIPVTPSSSLENSINPTRSNNFPVTPSPAKAPKPQPAKRSTTQNANSTHILSNHSPWTETPNPKEESPGRQPIIRERSSSQSDLLSDKVIHSQPPHHPKQRFWLPPNGVVHAATSHNTKEDVQNTSATKSSTPRHGTGECNTKDNTKLSNQKEEGEPVHSIKGFSDGNHIGHKNQPSHDAEMLKRFTSTTELQSRRVVDRADYIPQQESRLGQHSWSSESALFHPDSSTQRFPPGLTNDNFKTRNEKGDKQNPGINPRPTPVRPLRQSVQARQAMEQTSVPSRSSTADNSFSNSNLSTACTSDLSISSSPAQDHSRDVKHSPDQPQSQGSTFASPTHSPDESTFRNNSQKQEDANSPNNSFLSKDETPTSPQANSPFQTQITSNHTPDYNSSSPHQNTIKTPASHQITFDNSKSRNKTSPHNQRSPKLPPRYHPREPNPLSGISSASVEDLTRPTEDSNFPFRRKSYSSASYTSRVKSSSFSFSKRQPSMEELECDEKAKQLADKLECRDRRLSEALRQNANTKRMLYMDGLFSETEPAGLSPKNRSQTLPPSTAGTWSGLPENSKSCTLPRDHQTRICKKEKETDGESDPDYGLDGGRCVSDNEELMRQHKEELLDKLRKKLLVLKDEKATLQLQIADNCLLGQQVSQAADSKCPTEYEREKFRTHLDDVEKIVRLLLNLSGQLARAESAVASFGLDADDNVKRLALDKRERLNVKHEEAKQLKEDIDKRSGQLLVILQGRFSEQELADYSHLIRTKSVLAIQMQELEDQILLAESQVLALKRSLSSS